MVADFMGQVNLLPGRVREMRNGVASIELAADLTVAAAGGEGLAVGGRVEVAIRPENIRLKPPPDAGAAAIASVTGHVFLGNLSEYQVALRSGPVLRVQAHPLQQLAIGDLVAVEIDGECSAFPRIRGETAPE
jgi:iron(III) transport system ATP-binding protein